jgi:hypothetical protein
MQKFTRSACNACNASNACNACNACTTNSHTDCLVSAWDRSGSTYDPPILLYLNVTFACKSLQEVHKHLFKSSYSVILLLLFCIVLFIGWTSNFSNISIGWFPVDPCADIEIYHWDGQTLCPQTDYFCFDASF